jgi:hypothetical protein
MFFLRFRETLHFWWHHLWPLFAVTAPFALISLNIQWYAGLPYELLGPDDIQLNSTSLTLLMLLWPLASATLIAQLAAIQSGKHQSLGLCLLVALRSGGALLLGLLLMAFATGTGLLLLVLPGLWIYGRLLMLPFVLVLEGKSPLAALRESFLLSRAQQWPLLFGYYFLTLALLSISSLLTDDLSGLAFLPDWAAPLLGAMLFGLFGSLTDIYAFRFYVLARSEASQAERR